MTAADCWSDLEASALRQLKSRSDSGRWVKLSYEEADSILKLIEAARQKEGGWQPIETAPRDGTDVLVWAPHWRTPATAWTFGNDPWQGCRKDAHSRGPTHWRPLPAAPDAAMDGKGEPVPPSPGWAQGQSTHADRTFADRNRP